MEVSLQLARRSTTWFFVDTNLHVF